MARVGIIAAMFREVHPLVRNMQPLKYLPDGRVQIYQSKNAVIAYAGMGRDPAMIAARAVLSIGEISLLASVGWAGGLNPSAAAGKVVHPATVIDSLSGKRYSAGGSGGTLVTVQLVAGLEEKRRLGEQYRGDYVDMEAAAIAECAEEAKIPFHCFKAISDAHDARLPDMNQFNRSGQFSAWRFIAHIAVRPWLWRVVSDMSKASLDSRDALCKRLEQWIAENASTALKPETSKAG
ncbi:MAG TPA: hypothetical protein VNX88_15740 [Terriglobales bacterium]|nr:hypothetical protein [Terriglobales bacterium]